MITLLYECPYKDAGNQTVTITTDAVTLDEVLPVFEQFLKAIGYSFKGHIDIVADEKTTAQQQREGLDS